MIQIENIHKSFGESDILKGISTTFEKGKTNLIIGQSGSGKTVLMVKYILDLDFIPNILLIFIPFFCILVRVNGGFINKGIGT